MKKDKRKPKLSESKAEKMLRLCKISRSHQLKDAYSKVTKKYPAFVQDLVTDILKIDGYSEIEISYASGVSLEIIRKLSFCNQGFADRETFLLLLGLYARLFC